MRAKFASCLLALMIASIYLLGAEVSGEGEWKQCKDNNNLCTHLDKEKCTETEVKKDCPKLCGVCKQCKTIPDDSRDPNKKCQFPFVFRNVTHHKCTFHLSPGRIWCATEDSATPRENGKWGYCGQDCPIEKCKTRTCKNYGTCHEDEDGVVKCECSKPFSGPHCENVTESSSPKTVTEDKQGTTMLTTQVQY